MIVSLGEFSRFQLETNALVGLTLITFARTPGDVPADLKLDLCEVIALANGVPLLFAFSPYGGGHVSCRNAERDAFVQLIQAAELVQSTGMK